MAHKSANYLSLRKTPRGFAGHAGGRWGSVPQPPDWFTTSVQVCGIYPFGAGSARPTDGAPLGRDMLANTAICTDPEALYRAGVISSPSMMLFGINGVGKSTTIQTMALGMVGRGMTLASFDPMKGEHTALTRALGGTVFEVGPHGDKLNLLAPGPLGHAAKKIGGVIGEELAALARSKSIQQTQLMARISRGQRLKDIEDTVLAAIVDTALSSSRKPVSADLMTVFDHPSELVLKASRQSTIGKFHKKFSTLGDTLSSMLSGEMGELLGGAEAIEIAPGNPGGFCFDTSGISPSNELLLSAAMLGTWSLGMDAIDAHWELAQHEARLAAATPGYIPEVTWGGYVTLMDEFWFPIRHCRGIVDLADALSRTNRSKGVAEIKITHTPKDFLSLPNKADRETARGFAERAGLLGLMSLTEEDLRSLSKIKPLTEDEIALVSSFNASKSWGNKKMKNRTRRLFKAATTDGEAQHPDKATDSPQKATPPPGAGKILLKVEGRVGIPVQMLQTSIQKRLHIADERFRN
jgi:hypothetical protein